MLDEHSEIMPILLKGYEYIEGVIEKVLKEAGKSEEEIKSIMEEDSEERNRFFKRVFNYE
jgi:uncharacterized membrane-anchored protein